MSWERFKNLFARNWKEKLLALVLAILFWFMIKGQAGRSNMPYGWGTERSVRPTSRF
ncbi:hypothetical protein [Brevifollis gellanilyticus]|uniref:Uncharacterized protein n=1 Tax=Brevifollis gellanilyticus TaxID=748831 RepID=A0A512M278_9BACT|nr:hypothetical protein [Brevifollis gellanilyticus]GEP40843.1 hypothetical protein BGE01nite_01340 [Brevifollis gellanilyticus]